MKNSKIILIASVVIVIILGVLFLVLSTSDDPLALTSTSQSSTSAQLSQQESRQSAKNGELEESEDYIIPGYVKYDAATVAATSGTRVLFFHASWCPICNALEQNILEEGVPEGLTIFKANYDTDTELRKQYGVTVVSTSVQIDESGNLLKKWSGSLTIQQVIDQLI